jgi:hypothetical protein
MPNICCIAPNATSKGAGSVKSGWACLSCTRDGLNRLSALTSRHEHRGEPRKTMARATGWPGDHKKLEGSPAGKLPLLASSRAASSLSIRVRARSINSTGPHPGRPACFQSPWAVSIIWPTNTRLMATVSPGPFIVDFACDRTLVAFGLFIRSGRRMGRFE